MTQALIVLVGQHANNFTACQGADVLQSMFFLGLYNESVTDDVLMQTLLRAQRPQSMLGLLHAPTTMQKPCARSFGVWCA